MDAVCIRTCNAGADDFPFIFWNDFRIEAACCGHGSQRSDEVGNAHSLRSGYTVIVADGQAEVHRFGTVV